MCAICLHVRFQAHRYCCISNASICCGFVVQQLLQHSITNRRTGLRAYIYQAMLKRLAEYWINVDRIASITSSNRCGLSLQMSVVCLSVCMLVPAVSPAKTAEPVETTFGERLVGPRSHALMGPILGRGFGGTCGAIR